MTTESAQAVFGYSKKVWAVHLFWRLAFLLAFWINNISGSLDRNFAIAAIFFTFISIGPFMGHSASSIGFLLYIKKVVLMRILAIGSSILQIPVGILWAYLIINARAAGTMRGQALIGFIILTAYPIVSIILNAVFVFFAMKVKSAILPPEGRKCC